MANIGLALKAEIARVARRTLNSELQSLRKASADHRRSIAALKRAIADLGKRNKQLERAASKAPATTPSGEEPKARFSAKGLASNRARLGLSAEDFGRLIGSTGQSVYNWEAGKSVPRQQTVAHIAALRKVGKREVSQRLEHAQGKGVGTKGRKRAASA